MSDTKLVVLNGDAQSAYIDVRTESSNSEIRQVIVLGDPSVNNNVAAVASQDIAPSDQTTPGIVVRSAGSLSVSIAGSSGTIGTHINSTAGTINVALKPGTIAVSLDPGYELGSIKGINNSIQVHIISTAGTLNVKLDPSYARILDSGTLVLQQTVAGSTSGVSTSGTTLKSPISSRVIKVYALSLTTTAQVGLTAKFTNGSGASPTTKWQVAIQAPSQGVSGVNLAVRPPGYLFAMGSNETLSLVLDSASLVHYSVGYFLESA